MSGLNILHADNGNDVAGLSRVEVLAVVRVKLDQAPDTLGLAGGGVEHGVALGERARVDAREGQRTVAVVHDLEGQGAQRRLRVDLRERARLVAFHVDFRLRLDLGRIGQVVDDGVEHQLHALVLERRAAVGREEVERDRALADAALE